MKLENESRIYGTSYFSVSNSPPNFHYNLLKQYNLAFTQKSNARYGADEHSHCNEAFTKLLQQGLLCVKVGGSEKF